ncbi:MAG: DUF6146 family protein [Dysgonamonadaceae bacterium]|nr:DUF6146 family protein [Dysgonamonadaceae bacterium]MDD3728480.1 DUF6146 family protein [Dysgonamonadaceae bacterium]MDD4247243.1 DUF6146 family protein [Dysgonamonadaceae bacterium]MDD4606325.1 DUF6146 family protein [Dysgonamonadaceae bacterium]
MKTFDLFFRKSNHISSAYRTVLLLMVVVGAIVFSSCGTSKRYAKPENQRVEMKSDKDSTEYQLIVLDPGYESYLVTKPSANFYSQQYYENWNKLYVMEWNSRHRNPLRYGGFYETEINYDPMEDYGLDLNYRLYYYFQFIKDKYGIVLIDRGR